MRRHFHIVGYVFLAVAMTSGLALTLGQTRSLHRHLNSHQEQDQLELERLTIKVCLEQNRVKARLRPPLPPTVCRPGKPK